MLVKKRGGGGRRRLERKLWILKNFPLLVDFRFAREEGGREQRRGALCDVYTSPQKEGRICVVVLDNECVTPGREKTRSYTCQFLTYPFTTTSQTLIMINTEFC